MSNVYEAIKNFDFTIEERTALRTFFVNNPEKRAEAELLLSTCNNNDEIVACLKDLLKPEQPEIPIDITVEIVKKLVRPPGQFPVREILNDFLNEKPQVKIPLAPLHFSQIYIRGPGCITEDERDTYFVQNTKNECTELFIKLIGPLIYPPSVGKNEDSFHAFWDGIIKNSIELFGRYLPGLETMKFERNTNQSTSTGRNRPDMVILVRNICPFRGEEKAADSIADPSEELTKKFKEWNYGEAPYLLAYHATGSLVTFVTLSESEPVHTQSSKKRKRSEVSSERICEFNLEYFSHRIRAMNLLRNVCRILPTIVNMCPARDTPDFITLERTNGTIVELGYNVKKIFLQERSVLHLREIYSTLYQNNVRYTDKLEHATSLCAHLEPRGLQRTPTDVEELLQALICILICLKGMHGIKPRPILHRDIRWPNIVQHFDEYKKFILIDFDYAAFGSPKNGQVTKALKEFSGTGHAPETLVGKHDPKVDIWGVGYLINSCGLSVPREITEYALQLCANRPKKRPTASDALDEVIRMFKEWCPKSTWLNNI